MPSRPCPFLAATLTAFALLLARPAHADSATFTVPIVISTSGLAGSFYTSELSLTNRGSSATTVRFTYSAAFGGGGGIATDTLPAGSQKTLPDTIAYLISIGLPIPDSGNRGGVLRVEFTGLSSPDAGAATVRTTTAVGNGRAGLSYPAFRGGLEGAAYLCGLRQNETDRANVALLNAGAAGEGDVVLRLTAFSGDAAAPLSHRFPDLTLAPGAFRQYTEVLKDASLDKGYVRIERISGTAPYYAYATILDQKTSDGSFVPPLSEAAVYESNFLTLPVVVETSVFSTEVVLTNVSRASRTFQLSYVADAIQTADATASVSITLAAGEQRVIPSFVQFLRDRGVPGVGGPGATFAGALFLSSPGAETGGLFLGGRTQTAGEGRYGLFYTAMTQGTTATSAAWLYGLQQNGENRTNLALVNTGDGDSSTIELHVDLYDGDTGAITRSFDVTLAPRKWTQINNVLSPGLANGYARVRRTGGTNPFLAYAVVVDGGQPGTRSDDGAFVSLQVEEPQPSAELLAIRKVEARCTSLNGQGLSRLEFLRAVAATMATLPEYAVTGVDQTSLSAYGVFRNGRLHIVSDNRELDAPPQTQSRGDRAQSLATTELPVSGYARLLQSFGQTAVTQTPINDLVAMLEDPGGYAIRIGQVGDARLSALRNVSGDGFFYFNTHGARMYRTADQSDAGGVFCLQSSTPSSPAADLQPEIAADLAAGRVVYYTATPGAIDPITGRVWITQYGITYDFVKTYWRFAPSSVVFLNVCFSGYTTEPGGPQEFIDACLSKGAGVYFGWSKAANDQTCLPAVKYFVDRLVGANKFMKESPDQRAFPWELVLEDMKKRGLAHDPATQADLRAFPGAGGASVLLDPSIQYLVVDEYNETLELRGYFGSIPGKVTVGARELPGCAWGSDAVLCQLPRTGSGSNGDVFVEVKGELGRMRKSNVRQLTEWNIPIHYTWKNVIQPEWKFEGNGKLRFRADIGSFRKKPGEAPEFPLRGMMATRDSSLSVTGSGAHHESGPGYDYTETLGGSGVYKSLSNADVLAPVLFALAKVDAKTHQAALGLFLSAVAIPFRVTCAGSPCDDPNDLPPTFGDLQGDQDFPSPDPDGEAQSNPAITLTWDDQFRIPAKTFTDPNLGGTGSVMTIEWTQTISPTPAVKFDAAR